MLNVAVAHVSEGGDDCTEYYHNHTNVPGISIAGSYILLTHHKRHLSNKNSKFYNNKSKSYQCDACSYSCKKCTLISKVVSWPCSFFVVLIFHLSQCLSKAKIACSYQTKNQLKTRKYKITLSILSALGLEDH